MKRILVASALAVVVLSAGCTNDDQATVERLTIEDVNGQSFSSLDEAVGFACCTTRETSQPLVDSWPTFTEESVLEFWARAGDEVVYMAVETDPGIWLVATQVGRIVGGVEERQRIFVSCLDEELAQ